MERQINDRMCLFFNNLFPGNRTTSSAVPAQSTNYQEKNRRANRKRISNTNTRRQVNISCLCTLSIVCYVLSLSLISFPFLSFHPSLLLFSSAISLLCTLAGFYVLLKYFNHELSVFFGQLHTM